MSLAYRISAFNRQRKWQRFLELVAPTSETSILDVGYSDHEYSATDNFLEKHYPWRQQITALGIEEPVEFRPRYPDVKVVQYNGADFPFEDGQFDVCWSNAVVEHVGGYDRQRKFLSEIRRVSRRAFVTTPNLFFPIEVHTRTPLLHWLPKRWFDRFLHWRGQDWATGDYMHLLSRGAIIDLLAEAGVNEYQILTNRLGPFVLDFIMTWQSAGGAEELDSLEQCITAGDVEPAIGA